MPAGFAGGSRLEGEGDRINPISGRDHLSSIYVQNIRVRTKPNPYYVKVGAGLLRRAGREIRRLLPASGSRVFVITSPNVRRHWGEALEKSLRDPRLHPMRLHIPQHRSLDPAERKIVGRLRQAPLAHAAVFSFDLRRRKLHRARIPESRQPINHRPTRIPEPEQLRHLVKRLPRRIIPRPPNVAITPRRRS